MPKPVWWFCAMEYGSGEPHRPLPCSLVYWPCLCIVFQNGSHTAGPAFAFMCRRELSMQAPDGHDSVAEQVADSDHWPELLIFIAVVEQPRTFAHLMRTIDMLVLFTSSSMPGRVSLSLNEAASHQLGHGQNDQVGCGHQPFIRLT